MKLISLLAVVAVSLVGCAQPGGNVDVDSPGIDGVTGPVRIKSNGRADNVATMTDDVVTGMFNTDEPTVVWLQDENNRDLYKVMGGPSTTIQAAGRAIIDSQNSLYAKGVRISIPTGDDDGTTPITVEAEEFFTDAAEVVRARNEFRNINVERLASLSRDQLEAIKEWVKATEAISDATKSVLLSVIETALAPTP